VARIKPLVEKLLDRVTPSPPQPLPRP
jgi:hypothetical protein